MTKQMEELRDKLAEEEPEDRYFVFRRGFDACYAEMAPLISALEIYAMTNETFPEYGDAAREALKKIGVE